jgi:phosphoglycolate phosphatase
MALLLFDIDGTLLTPKGMGRRAFERALAEAYPGITGIPAFSYDGLLDPEIVRRTLDLMGREASETEVGSILEAYLDHLSGERPETSEGYLCPGVPDVLEEALRRGHTLGVLTGNVRRGALLKLGFFGLAGYFPCGAFGEDAPDRAGLVPVAVERIRRASGKEFGRGETWIVGDSPRDFSAASSAAIRCALVATGGTPKAHLEALRADLLLDNLARPEALWRKVEVEA